MTPSTNFQTELLVDSACLTSPMYFSFFFFLICWSILETIHLSNLYTCIIHSSIPEVQTYCSQCYPKQLSKVCPHCHEIMRQRCAWSRAFVSSWLESSVDAQSVKLQPFYCGHNVLIQCRVCGLLVNLQFPKKMNKKTRPNEKDNYGTMLNKCAPTQGFM